MSSQTSQLHSILKDFVSTIIAFLLLKHFISFLILDMIINIYGLVSKINKMLVGRKISRMKILFQGVG